VKSRVQNQSRAIALHFKRVVISFRCSAGEVQAGLVGSLSLLLAPLWADPVACVQSKVQNQRSAGFQLYNVIFRIFPGAL
jgi:hypothetical protein